MKETVLIITALVFTNFLVVSKVSGESDTPPPALSSEAAIIMEANTGTILYEKNSNEKMYPASLTKIATAIYAIESADLDEVVTVSSNARNIDGTTVYLEEGETISLKKLVQGLLINSGNDAGVAIAEHISGSVEQFSDDLNTYLTNVIGVQETNFENPHGLFDSDHVTTAKDLAKITQYAIQNETFKEIFGKKELEWEGQTWDTTIITHHDIVKGEIPYDSVTGGKNGYVNQSGFTLATTAEKDDLNLITITLKSSMKNESYDDTIKLLDFGFDNFTISYIEEGAKFTVNNEEYMAPKKITYAHPLNTDTMDRQVNENGTLNIVNEDGIVAASHQLDRVNKENKIDKNVSAYVKPQDKNEINAQTAFDNGYIYLALGYIFAALALILIGMVYRQTRNSVVLRK